MVPVLAFDIETVPDLEGLRRAHQLPPSLGDEDVLAWFAQRRRAATGGEFAPHLFQKVVAIGCVLRDATRLLVWSLGEEHDAEPELVRRFFEGIDKYTPQLVSWNGAAFDLPVLHYRALIHGVQATRYWDWGDDDRDFRYNNYLNRFHTRHLDLMDVLAQYSGRAYAGLDQVARLCGFPGKLGMDGSEVLPAVAAGRLREVRAYCECDVLNTYLVYQRFRLMRGELGPEAYAEEMSLVRERIAAIGAPHWQSFLAAWQSAG